MARTTFPVKITGPGPYDWEVQCVAPEDTSLDLADYVRQRLLRGDAIEVATPRTFDYPFGPVPPVKTPLANALPRKTWDGSMFNAITMPSQGDSMAAITFDVSSFSGPGYFTVNYETVKPDKEQPMSETTGIVNDLRRLAEKGEDISPISDEVNRLKAAKKNRIVNGLKGLADLAIMEKPEGSRFVLAFFKDDEAATLEGIDYAKNKSFPKDDEEDEYRVYVQPGDTYISDQYYTMNHLRKYLDNREIPYHIAYFD